MNDDLEQYEKFPCILKLKLKSGEVKFPRATRFHYDPISTFRAVERSENDFRPISRDDFRSYFELGRKRKVRGRNEDITSNPRYYGVSTSTSKEKIEQLMKFPNPNKKMARGYVMDCGGPECTEGDHVCWWLFENADVSNFELVEE